MSEYLKKIGLDSVQDFLGTLFLLFCLFAGAYKAMGSFIYGYLWIIVSTFAAIHFFVERNHFKKLLDSTFDEWERTDKKINDLNREPTEEEIIASLIERELSRKQIDRIYKRIESGFWVVPPDINFDSDK